MTQALSTPEKTARKAPRGARKKGRRGARNGRSERGKDGKPKEGWRETLRFWFWAIVIMIFLRVFFIEPYRIPTPSMEESLLVGDYLFVSKLHYGARTPNTIGIPFTRIYLRGLEFPQTRLPGFSEPKRGDVAVFNYPPESGPIERRTPYIKRLVGIPGDEVLVLDKELYVNGERVPLTETQQGLWRIRLAEGRTLRREALDEIGAEYRGQTPPPDPALVAFATPGEAEALRALDAVASVDPYVLPEERALPGLFPAGAGYNTDHYGPVAVPAEGQTVPLTAATWPLYEDAITRFEGRDAELRADGRVYVDGAPVETYTFEQDYYFAMGDNRDNSQDSRFWGFVPHDHLVGKAVFVFFSVDLERYLPRLRGFLPIR